MNSSIELFADALELKPPWYVASIEPDAGEKPAVLARLAFTPGSVFPCGSCGTAGCKAYDTHPKEYRHLDFLHHQTILVVSVPRVTCPSCGVRQAELPWARPRTKFTYPFEHRIAELAARMPLRDLAEIVDVDTDSLLRVVRHYVNSP